MDVTEGNEASTLLKWGIPSRVRHCDSYTTGAQEASTFSSAPAYLGATTDFKLVYFVQVLVAVKLSSVKSWSSP
jgi:hypothetical protein